jgi:hypothetical protein
MTLPFKVIRSFKATYAISGREHEFKPGDVISCDTGQAGQTVTIEVDNTLFLVDRPTFSSSCIFKNEGPPL